MTRINDLDPASAQATAVASMQLWGVFNNKDYRVPVGNLRNVMGEAVACTLQNTGADNIASGQILLFDGVLWGSTSYFNASSATGIHIFHDLFDYVTVHAMAESDQALHGVEWAVIKNGVVIPGVSVKYFQSLSFPGAASPMYSPPIQVNSGDVIGIVKVAGATVTNLNYYGTGVWISIIPEVFK